MAKYKQFFVTSKDSKFLLQNKEKCMHEEKTSLRMIKNQKNLVGMVKTFIDYELEKYFN